MNAPHQNYLHRILGLLVVVSAVPGTLRTMLTDGQLDYRTFLYFTILSNIAIAVAYLFFLRAGVWSSRIPISGSVTAGTP